jgi:S-adenosylmethionine decarboxylase
VIRSHHFSAILNVSDAIATYTAADFITLLKHSVCQVGLTPVAELTHTFDPQGISAIVVLEESHVALHAWDECGKVTVDIHVCDYYRDNYGKAKILSELLTQAITGRCDRSYWNYVVIEG